MQKSQSCGSKIVIYVFVVFSSSNPTIFHTANIRECHLEGQKNREEWRQLLVFVLQIYRIHSVVVLLQRTGT